MIHDIFSDGNVNTTNSLPFPTWLFRGEGHHQVLAIRCHTRCISTTRAVLRGGAWRVRMKKLEPQVACGDFSLSSGGAVLYLNCYPLRNHGPLEPCMAVSGTRLTPTAPHGQPKAHISLCAMRSWALGWPRWTATLSIRYRISHRFCTFPVD